MLEAAPLQAQSQEQRAGARDLTRGVLLCQPARIRSGPLCMVHREPAFSCLVQHRQTCCVLLPFPQAGWPKAVVSVISACACYTAYVWRLGGHEAIAIFGRSRSTYPRATAAWAWRSRFRSRCRSVSLDPTRPAAASSPYMHDKQARCAVQPNGAVCMRDPCRACGHAERAMIFPSSALLRKMAPSPTSLPYPPPLPSPSSPLIRPSPSCLLVNPQGRHQT